MIKYQKIEVYPLQTPLFRIMFRLLASASLSFLFSTPITLYLIRRGYLRDEREAFEAMTMIEVSLWYVGVVLLSLLRVKKGFPYFEVTRDPAMWRCATIMTTSSLIAFFLTIFCQIMRPFERWVDVVLVSISLQLSMALILTMTLTTNSPRPTTPETV